ncbi:hypothetical protein WJX75_007875 [Coccomyxa subellipsoidea]|uniref:Uncharacterized protein n=1 Tax=Coccomyxa subellipsoidea TaxID=248742 RepID=A0ABR2Z0Q4_9CHLO
MFRYRNPTTLPRRPPCASGTEISSMETCASRPSSSMDTVTDITTSSRSACDTAELERCRGKALDLAHDHNKENVPPSHGLGRLSAGASKGSLAASGKRKRVPLQDVTQLYASDRNFYQSVRLFR